MHPVGGGGDLQAGQVVAALILEDHGAAAVADAAVCATSSGGWERRGQWGEERDRVRLAPVGFDRTRLHGATKTGARG